MKNLWLITFRSVTYAQRGERILQREKIPCRLQRTPKELTQRGCGYCLRLRESGAMAAVALFAREGLPYEGLYALTAEGAAEVRRP